MKHDADDDLVGFCLHAVCKEPYGWLKQPGIPQAG